MNELAILKSDVEQMRVKAYRQARVFEPNMESYHAAMAVYSAAFGKPEGEVGVVTPDGVKQSWELGSISVEHIEIHPPDPEGDIVVRLVGHPGWHLAAHGATLSEALGRLAEIIKAAEDA